MNIIFLSNTCSQEKYKEIFNSRTKKRIDPSQKFFEQLLYGISQGNKAKVFCVSEIPVSSSLYRKKRIFKQIEHINDQLLFYYIPFFNGKVSRFVSSYYSCIKSIREIINNYQLNLKQTIIITDGLNLELSLAGKRIAGIFNLPFISFLTDLPSFSTNMKERNFLKRIWLYFYQRKSEKILKKSSGYITITESVNTKINHINLPHIVVEGSVDCRLPSVFRSSLQKEKSIIYAGGVYKSFGVDKLIQAFLLAKLEGFKLEIYGNGDLVNEIKRISRNNNSIIYRGVALNIELFDIESNAMLLVNPRPTNSEFTKYSFPSKTLEYLSTGTPVLSTKLDGIPTEYFPYIFWFEKEDVLNMSKKLKYICSQSSESLIDFGKKGREFVIREKSSIIVGDKIVEFCSLFFK